MEKMFHRLRDQDLVRITRVVQAEFASFPELAQFYFDEVIVRADRALRTRAPARR